MSSLHKFPSADKKSNRYRLSFYLADKQRKQVWLGKNVKVAEEIQKHIDHLLACSRYETKVEEKTQAWLKRAHRKLVKKLQDYGLCGEIKDPTVADFIADYIKSQSAAAPATITKLEQAKTSFVDFIGQNTRMSVVTKDDAKRYHQTLNENPKLGANTVNRRCGFIRQFFSHAVELDLIPANPFALTCISTTVGAAAKSYVARETVQKVIEACPNSEWKLLLAFARFVGCRVPSEIRDLVWDDIHWDEGTILLKSPKTARKGKPERFVPIFPDVRELLDQRYDFAAKKSLYVFPTLRSEPGISTVAARVVQKAGVIPWSKLFNAMRASCETDLMDQYGIRKACLWIGNTPGIASKHYALIKKSDYLEAAGMLPEKNGAKSYPVGSGGEMLGDAATPQKREESANCGVGSGRYLTRTSDLHDVNVAL